MKTHHISRQQVAIYQAIRGREKWLGSSEIATIAGVNPRTTRDHLRRMALAGVAERVAMHPGHRYRLSLHTKEAKGYQARIEQAELVYDGLAG
tara:strand:- start:127 stop:405 length:279 start_codon:yes stop_codon:yes gene_type:complete